MLRSMKLTWLLWALVTAVSSAVGLTVGERLIYSTDPLLRVPVLVGTSGLFIGFGQWTILRTKLTKAQGWILATPIGLTLGFLIGLWVLDDPPANALALEVGVIVGGLLAGMLQWYALRRKLSGSLKWILVSALSWGIGLNLATLVLETYFTGIGLGSLLMPVFGLLIGALAGIISGAFVETGILETV